VTVKEILKDQNRSVVTVAQTASVAVAMGTLIENRIGCLPVLDKSGQLVGILSDKDILRAVNQQIDSFQQLTVDDLMTSELIVGLIDDDINYIAGLMTKNRVRHIPIVTKNKLIGVVSIGDVVKNQMEDMKIENRYLKQYINGGYPG
jgi:CBS domain-containing protein